MPVFLEQIAHSWIICLTALVRHRQTGQMYLGQLPWAYTLITALKKKKKYVKQEYDTCALTIQHCVREKKHVMSTMLNE